MPIQVEVVGGILSGAAGVVGFVVAWRATRQSMRKAKSDASAEEIRASLLRISDMRADRVLNRRRQPTIEEQARAMAEREVELLLDPSLIMQHDKAVDESYEANDPQSAERFFAAGHISAADHFAHYNNLPQPRRTFTAEEINQMSVGEYAVVRAQLLRASKDALVTEQPKETPR